MEDLVENIIKLNYDEITSYTFPTDQAFGLEVLYQDIKFCFIINFSSKNKNLICCGPGAHSRTSKTSDGKIITPPFFDRWSWFKYFEESFIAYADPIFFKDEYVRIGWFVGDRNNWYLEILSNILKKLMKNQKIFPNNTLFYSSSGGGFTSVCLGTLIKGSKVIMNNAQLFIMNFIEEHVNDLFRILEKEFSELNRDEIINTINYRLNVIELFKKENYIPSMHYYVNLESDQDYYKQCIPFINELKKLPYYENNLTLFPYKQESNNPHWPLPTDQSIKILQSFSKQYLYNNMEENNNKLKNNLIDNYEILNMYNPELKNSINYDCIFYDKGITDSHNTNYLHNLNVLYSENGTTISYNAKSGSKFYRTVINGVKWLDFQKNYKIDLDFSFERDSTLSSAAIGLGDASIELFKMFGNNSLKGVGHLTFITQGDNLIVFLDNNHISFLDQTMNSNTGLYFQIYRTAEITFQNLKIHVLNKK